MITINTTVEVNENVTNNSLNRAFVHLVGRRGLVVEQKDKHHFKVAISGGVSVILHENCLDEVRWIASARLGRPKEDIIRKEIRGQ